MRSKITKRILNETPAEVRMAVRQTPYTVYVSRHHRRAMRKAITFGIFAGMLLGVALAVLIAENL